MKTFKPIKTEPRINLSKLYELFYELMAGIGLSVVLIGIFFILKIIFGG